MKLLYISTPAFADCDFPLIKSFQDKGIDVTYLIMLAPYSLNNTIVSIKEQIEHNGIMPAIKYEELQKYSSYLDMNKVFIANRCANKDSSLTSLIVTLKVIQFIFRGHFDVIHIDSILKMWESLIYVVFHNKIVQTMHDPFPHTGEHNWRVTLSMKIIKNTIKRFVVLNEKQKDDFCSKHNIPQSNVFTNRLGPYNLMKTFAKPNIEEQKHNVLFFGRISPYKGVEQLCKAMIKVHEQIPDATLTIAGGGKMYFDIDSYRKYDWLNIQNHYIPIEDIAEYVQRCSFVVCPYTDATQSGVIMTAYGLNKPVIATKVGGLPEMVIEGKTGLLIPPNDIEALATAIIQILNDDDTRHKLYNYIHSNYFLGDLSWNTITDKYVSIYNSIL